MSAKHTPGPWFVADKQFTGGATIVSSGDPEFGGDSIADVSACGPWISEETVDADARLIAAAPDFFAAAIKLEEAETHHANCVECEGEGIPELCPLCFPLFDDARCMRHAAIAKATRETAQSAAKPTALP